MNIVIYCRVSSRDQVDGTSLDSQETACREYARGRGWTVLHVFVEEGESAKVADRTQLVALLDFCKDKRRGVEMLLVWKIDRFARNIEDHFALKATLKRLGVQIVSVTEPLEQDPTGRLMEIILAGFAQFDNDVRTVRTVQGMQQRIQEGLLPWKPPIGYLAPRLGKKREPDLPDPQRFELVKRAWELMATGAYSKAAIVRLLRSWGLRAPRGGTLGPQLIDKMFRNAYYAGVIRNPWTGAELRGRHVAMVSVEDFARVQQIVAGHHHSEAHHRVVADFPVRGLVRCPLCHWPLSGGWSKGRRQPYGYYFCLRRGCARRRKSLPAKMIHEEFFEGLRELDIAPHTANMLSAVIKAVLARETDGLRAAEARHAERLTALQRRLHELITLRTDQLIADDEFRAHRDALRRQILEVQAASTTLHEWPLEHDEISGLIRALSNLEAHWMMLAPLQRQAFGRCVFPAGYLVQKIRTADRGLLFRTFEPSADDLSTLVDLMKRDPNTVFVEIRKFLAIIGDVAEPETQAA